MKDADRILALDGGRVVETGTHDELIELDVSTLTSGGYRRATWRTSPGNSSKTPSADGDTVEETEVGASPFSSDQFGD